MNNPMNLCPLCGHPSSYIQMQRLTISACSSCMQANVLERNIIIRIEPDKLLGQAYIQREFLMVALVMQAMYKNWEKIADVHMGE